MTYPSARRLFSLIRSVRPLLIWLFVLGGISSRALLAAPPADVVIERYVAENINNCNHILVHDTQELVTANSKLLVRASNGEPLRPSPLSDLKDAHSVAYSPRTGLYYVNDTGHHRLVSFRDPLVDRKEITVDTIAGVKLDRPHDVVVDDDGWIYVINPNPPTTVFRFRDLGVEESGLDLSAHLTYSRALTIANNRLYVIGSSVGKVIEVTNFAKKEFTVHESFGKKKDSPAGSWTTTGLVPNDADFFNGWWYVTSYFCPEYANGTDYNEQKLIRFKTWDDFCTGQWEDLSSLLPDKVVPYYLTPTKSALLLTAFIHEAPAHPGGVWRLRKK